MRQEEGVMSYYQRFTIKNESGEELFQRNTLRSVFRKLEKDEFFVKNPDEKLYITENNTKEECFKEMITASTTESDIQDKWSFWEQGL